MKRRPKKHQRFPLAICTPLGIVTTNAWAACTPNHRLLAFPADISRNHCEIGLVSRLSLKRYLDPQNGPLASMIHGCVPHCDEGFYADGDKCKRCSGDCQTCSQAELCDKCHGAKLLIDVKHYGHLDHGRCVDKCPDGLIADYSNTIQAKCVLKKNPCSAGYFENIQSVCLECDKSCSTCHGAGPLQCDECALGYGNRTMGYCRKCCSAEQLAQKETHCEDCAKKGPSRTEQLLSPFALLANFFTIVGLVLLGTVLFYMCRQLLSCARRNEGMRSDLQYTPLTNLADENDNGKSNKRFNNGFELLADESDSDDDSLLNEETNLTEEQPKPSKNKDLARIVDTEKTDV